MGFQADKVVDPLDFDFSAFGGPVGTIPEPTDQQIFQLQEDLSAGLVAVGVPADQLDDMEAIAKATATLDRESQQTFLEAQTEALARLCGGEPTLEQIQALPFRIRAAFFGWLIGEFRPEA